MAFTSSTYNSGNFDHLVICTTLSGMLQAPASGKGPALNRVVPHQCMQILNFSKMEILGVLRETSSEIHSISCSSLRHVAGPQAVFHCSWANPAQDTALPHCTSAAPFVEHIAEKWDIGIRQEDKMAEETLWRDFLLLNS